ncbi:MAG: hypothetical protein ACR2KL_10070 [Nocardioidaceae bacterium]
MASQHLSKGDDMGVLSGILKAGVVTKAVQVARREASKPENQAKAKELFTKIASRRKGTSTH